MVLVCATMWWPLSARLSMALIAHGCRVSAVCPPGHPLRYISGVEAVYPYRGLGSIESLRKAIATSQPDLIVPGDDGVVWQLHELHAKVPELRGLIEKSLGSSEGYATIRSRGAFLQRAAEIGIRVPDTRTIASASDLNYLAENEPSVLKLDGTWGGSGVAIARSKAEAVAAFRKLSQPMGIGTSCKRFLVNRDPLALWSWGKREKPRVTAQQFVSGRPANTMFACWEGEVLGIVTVEVLAAQGSTGAATVVRIVRNGEIETAARLLAKELKLSGFHGLDFMIENSTGAAYLIELNPRCTQLGHLPVAGQGDLAGLIAARLSGVAAVMPCKDECIQGDTVAFFPQTFTWNPASVYLVRGYHDVPWEEPELVRQLIKKPWPERQWLSRVYHHFRVTKRQDEVRF